MLELRPVAPPLLARLFATAAIAAAAVAPAAACAQATPRNMDGLRVGVVVGGPGLFGLSVEWIGEDRRGVEATLSTWSFRDVGVALTARQYFGGGYLRPVVGAGLWLSHSFAEGASGTALLVRVPVGVDWRATGEHFLGVTVAVNRVLWVVRGGSQPPDPPNEGQLVPLPELAWRWRP